MEDCSGIVFDKGNTPFNEFMQYNELNYCCTDCSSLIEILHINENKNIIEFKCSNKNNSHQKSIEINKYLEERKQNKKNKSNINRDICNEHGQKFLSYCLDCNKHICEKCQNKGIHLLHYKINIIEIEPSKEEKEILDKIIKYYEKQIDKISNENIYKFKKLDSIKKQGEETINKIKEKKIKECNEQKELQLKNVEEKYLNKIKILKKEFDENFKKLKLEFKLNYYRINNEFKLKEEKIFYFFQNKKENLFKIIKKYTNSLELIKIKLNSLTNIKKLNELVYNTYNEYPKNIFNIINISRVIMIQNDENIDIKNKIIDKIIKNNNEKIFSISRKITDFKKAFEQKISSNIMMNSNKKQDIKKKVNVCIKKNKPEPIIKPELIIKPEPIRNNFTEKKISIRNDYKRKEKKINEDLFLIFNNIFYKNKEQTTINNEKLNGIRIDSLREIYYKYKKEGNERILINYFDSFLKCNVLKIFERKYIDDEIINVIKYNIETICEIFELNKNIYYNYYFPKNNTGLKNRKKSSDAARQFRKSFSIDESIIKEEELLKRLDSNDDDIYKVFQQMYG